jgi:hypothetical protein
MAGRLREAAMKTPKQVEAIENTKVFHGNVGFYATFPKCEFMLV